VSFPTEGVGRRQGLDLTARNYVRLSRSFFRFNSTSPSPTRSNLCSRPVYRGRPTVERAGRPSARAGPFDREMASLAPVTLARWIRSSSAFRHDIVAEKREGVGSRRIIRKGHDRLVVENRGQGLGKTLRDRGFSWTTSSASWCSRTQGRHRTEVFMGRTVSGAE